MNESISRGFFRSFMMRLGTIMGILLGVFLSFMVMGLFLGKSDGDSDLKYAYSPTILANADDKREVLDDDAPVILKLNIEGTIGLKDLTRNKIRELLIESREKTLKDGRVKAILLNIDSPGGTVTDADGIYRLLKDYKERYHVPIYAHVDGLCASGGMYIACAADKILSSESSVIGSIGVLVPTAMNYTKLMEKLGVDSLTMTAGKGKDELNPFRPWKPNESANIQGLVDDFYQTFVGIVTENRPEVNRERLVTEYGANIFTAPKAKEIGLIDESGVNYNQALALLAKDASLEEGKYQVIELSEDNWLSSLFKAEGGMSLLKGEVTHRLEIQGELDPTLMNKFLYYYRG
jgi:signal peptide peptidase SppA